MALDQHYGNIIWTNHALDRLAARKLPQSMAFETFKHPDSREPGKQQGTTELVKMFGQSKVTLIATQNEKNEWIILSTWVDPPLPGSIDVGKKERYQKYKADYDKASRWGKFWLEFKRQLGF